MVSLLVSLLVLALVWWLASYIATSLGAPPPILVIVNVIFAIILILWLLQAFGLFAPGVPLLR